MRADSRDTDALLYLGVFHSQSVPDPGAAKVAFRRFWKHRSRRSWGPGHEPSLQAATMGMCNLLYAEGDGAGLRLWAGRAARFLPTRPNARLYQARAAAMLGQRRRAIAAYARVLREHSDLTPRVRADLETVRAAWPEQEDALQRMLARHDLPPL